MKWYIGAVILLCLLPVLSGEMSARDSVVPIVFAAMVLILYPLPWMYAKQRKHHQSDAILLVNLLLGWTGIGWIVAAVWASTAVRPTEAALPGAAPPEPAPPAPTTSPTSNDDAQKVYVID